MQQEHYSIISTDLLWGELQLEKETKDQITAIKDLLSDSTKENRNWSIKKMKPGYRALFYGPSGTGKTLAAKLLGKALEKHVFKIDLSKVVSKYIGETEKNLSAIFAAATTSNAILFFDEADALFGKRTEVKDAHDRFANIEISYLLQRMENYHGLSIIASNGKQNIDDAFIRRFQSVIHFPAPKV